MGLGSTRRLRDLLWPRGGRQQRPEMCGRQAPPMHAARNPLPLAGLAVMAVVAAVGLWLSAATVAAAAASAATVPPASNSTAEYFTLMRAYLGEDGFARHPCLAQQEKHGWVSAATRRPMRVFTWGTEGVGHHTFESLFGSKKGGAGAHYFSTLHGNGGQDSVPSEWRYHQRVTKEATHNKDIATQVHSGDLLIFAIRYPPSTLLSAVSRFQNTSWSMLKHGDERGRACNAYVSGCDEVFTLHDSLSYVDDVLGYPKFDCGRLVIVPFELLTQRPLALYAPLSQAMQLSQMGAPGYDLLEARLRNIKDHAPTATAEGGHRYDIMEAMCADLGLSNHSKAYPPATVARAAALARAMDPDFASRQCADRMYSFAEVYFDERRYMFKGVYPGQALIAASRAKHPRSGLHFDDLLPAGD